MGAVAFSAALNVVQLVSALVLARTLDPRQYGAFAVGATVVGFGRFLGDCGAASALIQGPRVEANRRSLGNALFLQAVVAVAAAGFLIGAAPFLRQAFHAPAETALIVALLATTLIIEAPSVIPRIRLRHSQRYQREQLIGLGTVFATYGVQIGGLLAGFQVWSLVAGQIVGSVVLTIAMTTFGGGLVRPARHGALALARRGLAYQGTLVVQATFSVSSLAVVGTRLDTRELGLWTWCTVLATPLISLAYSLQNVSFPSLSRLYEHHPDRGGDAVAVVARLQFLFISVAVGALGGLASPLIRYVFDEKWLAATSAARIALLGVLPLIMGTLLAASLQASGRPRLRLRAMVISSVLGVLAAVPLSERDGVTGAAIAIYLLVPLVDVLLMIKSVGVDVRRACLNALLVGGTALAVALSLANIADGVVRVVVALAAASIAGLATTPLVDQSSLRTGWSSLRGSRS